MSSALDAIFSQSVVALQSSGHGRVFRVVAANNAGLVFTGTLETVDPLDPAMVLGDDPREKAYLKVLNSVDFVKSQMTVEEGRMEFGQFIGEQRWKLVSGDRNPADAENKFVVVKLVGDDR